MKQIVPLMLATVLGFALAACSPQAHPEGKNADEVAAEVADEGVAESKGDDAAVSATDSSGFVELAEAVPDVILEPRYYSTYNFVGERIEGYEEPVALMTAEAAEALKGASEDLNAQGYRLIIYDAYRPQTAVNDFIAWSQDPGSTEMKAYFYPDEAKETLFEKGYLVEKSGHTRGSTVDLSLFDMATGEPVDMGGTFDYFGEISYPDATEGLTEQQIANRKILADAMIANGFKPFDTEWWHFTLADEPYPDTYFDFPVASLD